LILAIAYERIDKLLDRLLEVTAALSLNSTDPEVRNLRAVLEAELGDLSGAGKEWARLIQTVPDYPPAPAIWLCSMRCRTPRRVRGAALIAETDSPQANVAADSGEIFTTGNSTISTFSLIMF